MSDARTHVSYTKQTRDQDASAWHDAIEPWLYFFVTYNSDIGLMDPFILIKSNW